jgi:ribosome biogenesis protein BMS1
VEPPKFYNPVTSLLVSSPDQWTGMRTLGQLRRDERVPLPHRPDSVYRPIERTYRKFNKMKIPKSLEVCVCVSVCVCACM